MRKKECCISKKTIERMKEELDDLANPWDKNIETGVGELLTEIDWLRSELRYSIRKIENLEGKLDRIKEVIRNDGRAEPRNTDETEKES